MNAHRKAIQGARKVYALSQTAVAGDERGVHAARSIKPCHWWGEQQGPHTLRPISMVQRIKLPFTDKRHSGLLLVTLALQQVLAEWEMAPLRLNHRSTHPISALGLSVAPAPRFLTLTDTNRQTVAETCCKRWEEEIHTTAGLRTFWVHVSHEGNLEFRFNDRRVGILFWRKVLSVELSKQWFDAREGLEQKKVDKLKPLVGSDMETAQSTVTFVLSWIVRHILA